MSHLSIRLPEEMKAQLLDMRGRMGVDNRSSVVRQLLIWAIQHYDLGSDSTLLRQMATYTIRTHCLIEEFVLNYVDKGDELRDKAYEKAGKMFTELLEKISLSD